MTIKSIVFLASQHLDQITDVKIKKSHIYEFFAAAFGFNSYASLGKNLIFIENNMLVDQPQLHEHKIRTRCLELGYIESSSNLISSHLPVFISEKKVTTLDLEQLIQLIRPDSEFHGQSNEAFGGTEWITNEDKLSKLILQSPVILKALEENADLGNPLAHYALALAYAEHEELKNDETLSDYWFKQQLAGNQLTEPEISFAASYLDQQSSIETIRHHLGQAIFLNKNMTFRYLAQSFF